MSSQIRSNTNVTISGGVRASGSLSAGSNDSKPLIMQKMPPNELQKLLDELNISLDEYQKIVDKNPNFNSLPIDEQRKCVLEYKQTVSVKNAESEISSEESVTIQQTENSTGFKKSEFNKKNINEKIDILEYEIAKNLYIYGSKDIKGVNGEVLPAHGEDAWNNLSDKKKDEQIANFILYSNGNEKLKKIIEELYKNGESDDPKLQQRTNKVLNSLINRVQASDMSIVDFLELPQSERAQKIYTYLNNLPLEERSDYDQAFINTENDILSEVSEISGIADLTITQSDKYITNNNLSKNEILYERYLKIPEDKRTPVQKGLISKYSELKSSDAGQSILKREKLARLEKLNIRYADLQKKQQSGTITEEEQADLIEIGNYLNSEEAKSLDELRQYLPQPSDVYERGVAADIEELQTIISENRFTGLDNETMAAVEFIEKQTKNMSREEKSKYIASFLKLNNTDYLSALFTKYAKEFPELYKMKELTLPAALDIANASAEQQKVIQNNAYELSTDPNNKLDNEAGISAFSTIGDIYQTDECKDKKFDEVKDSYSTYTSQLDNVILHNKSIDVNATISDSQLRKKGYEKILKSEHVTSATGVYALENLGKHHEDDRIDILDLSTSRWNEATKYAAEHDVISQLGTDDQANGFDLLYGRISEQFEGDEASEYLNSLVNQIPDMDPKAQSSAYDTVFSSGNESAIEVAFSNLEKVPAAIQEEVLVPILNNAINKNNQDSVDELAEKIKNGSYLTTQEYNSLTSKQKEEYKAAYFKSLPPAKQVALVVGLSDINVKKSMIKKIAQNNPSFLKQIIDNDAKTAEMIFDIGIMQDYIKGMAEFKSKANNDYKNLLEHINKKELAENIIHNDERPVTARTLNKYSTTPNGLGGEQYAFFKKDPYGNLIV